VCLYLADGWRQWMWMRWRIRSRRQGRGFTLVELLVVIVIVALVSIVVIPTVVTSLGEWQVVGAVSRLQAALVAARDRAALTGNPAGIRLLPDPSIPLVRLTDGRLDPSAPLALGSWVVMAPAADYAEGLVSIVSGPPSGYALPFPCLLLEQAPRDARGLSAAPTSWWWNVRVGERVRINGGGRQYTVVGPMAIGPAAGNVEMFVNAGPPGTPSILDRGQGPVEFLFLVNGRDDDGDGYTDDGFDGIDNDLNGAVDDAMEWESEVWDAALAGGVTAVPYVIRRRPAPVPSALAEGLPAGVVIDCTTWATSRERSRCLLDPYTGVVELLVNPDGSLVQQMLYSTPASLPMAAAFVHLWVCERGAIAAPAASGPPYLPMPSGTPGRPSMAPPLEGERRLVSIHARTGRVSVHHLESFDAANPSAPFLAAQRGEP
jgi:prepilin-type N-terminal cleavage/methylation domain-containing protein